MLEQVKNKSIKSKITVNSPNHEKYHNQEMYIIGEEHYLNSIGENCTWYKLSFNPGAGIADLYLGKNQIIK